MRLPIFHVHQTVPLTVCNIIYCTHRIQPHGRGDRSPLRSYFKPGGGPGSRTKRSLAVLRNRITRRLRNDAETEGRKVDKEGITEESADRHGEGLTPFEQKQALFYFTAIYLTTFVFCHIATLSSVSFSGQENVRTLFLR